MAFTKIILVLVLVCSLTILNSNATEYPTPPPVPAKFENAKEIQTYLGKLHNYYMIVGRPRFGKRSFASEVESNESPYASSDELAENTDDKLMSEALALFNMWSKLILNLYSKMYSMICFMVSLYIFCRSKGEEPNSSKDWG